MGKELSARTPVGYVALSNTIPSGVHWYGDYKPVSPGNCTMELEYRAWIITRVVPGPADLLTHAEDTTNGRYLPS